VIENQSTSGKEPPWQFCNCQKKGDLQEMLTPGIRILISRFRPDDHRKHGSRLPAPSTRATSVTLPMRIHGMNDLLSGYPPKNDGIFPASRPIASGQRLATMAELPCLRALSLRRGPKLRHLTGRRSPCRS